MLLNSPKSALSVSGGRLFFLRAVACLSTRCSPRGPGFYCGNLIFLASQKTTKKKRPFTHRMAGKIYVRAPSWSNDRKKKKKRAGTHNERMVQKTAVSCLRVFAFLSSSTLITNAGYSELVLRSHESVFGCFGKPA